MRRKLYCPKILALILCVGIAGETPAAHVNAQSLQGEQPDAREVVEKIEKEAVAEPAEAAGSKPITAVNQVAAAADEAGFVVDENGVLTDYIGTATTLVIPEGVVSIGSYAFDGNTNLISISFPESLTSIENNAFSGCTKLNNISLPKGLTSIGSYAFSQCAGLSNISLPEGLTSIGEAAFYLCESLRDISLPEGLTSIGEAAFFRCSNLSNISLSEGLTGIGPSAFYGCTSLSNISLPESLTSIGSDAFTRCTSLTSIALPKGITTIREYTFSSCSKLSSVILPEGLESIGDSAFSNADALSSIVLPESIASIGSLAFEYSVILYGKENSAAHVYAVQNGYAFRNIGDIVDISDCTVTLTETSYGDNGENYTPTVTITDGNTELIKGIDFEVAYQIGKEIGTAKVIITGKGNYTGRIEKTFSSHAIEFVVDKSGVLTDYLGTATALVIPEGVVRIGSDAFAGNINISSITFPKSLTSIEDNAFLRCTNLSNISLPEGLTRIGSNAFSGCKNLSSISLPEGLTDIGSYAFYECISLSSISLPRGLTGIGSNAFSRCTDLSSISLPEGLTSIGSYAFTGCTKLNNISLPRGLTSIESYAFSQCAGLSNISLPEGLTSIGEAAFYLCESLRDISLPEGLTSIGEAAFFRCSNLSNISLSEGLTGIGPSAFYGCTSLSNISLPESLTSIGSDAFTRCTSLTSIALPKGITTIREYTFSSCSKLSSVILPEGLESIGDSAFSNADALSSIVLPESIVSIGSLAFEYSVILYGKENSAAHVYAVQNGYVFRIIGNIADITDCTVTLAQTSYEYNGASHTPAITVTDGNTELVKGIDYEAAYQGGKEIGTAKVIVTGKGNYTGSIEKTFTIHAIDLAGCVVSLAQSSYTYDGTAKKPTVVVKRGTKVLTLGTDYRITYQNNVNAGTGQAIVTGIGNYKSSKTMAYRIVPKSIAGLTIATAQGTYTYNGSARKPAVKVSSGSKILQPGIDYKVTYQQNVNAGTLKMVVTGMGNYTSSWGKSYTIKRASQSFRGTYTYQKAFGAKAFTLNIKRRTGNGALSYKSSNTKIATVSSKGKVTIKGTGVVTITVTAKQTLNYNARTQKVTIKVSPKKQVISKLKTAAGKKLGVSWKADARATGYEIQLATDKKFKRDRKQATITKNRTKTTTIKSLKTGKRYYVRIRSYKTVKINKKNVKLYGTWSTIRQSGRIRK